MQVPENTSNNDIRDAIIQLREELGAQVKALDDKIEKLDYKFDTYQKGTDSMVRMATTIIIATASVVVLSSLSPAVMALVTAFAASIGS